MTKSPFLSVIIPSYNEQKNLQRGVLNEVASYLQKQTYSWEVILADDGSNDGTTEKLEAFAHHHPSFRVLKNIHAGKGPTVQAGMANAEGKWRLFCDFDQSTPLSEIEKLMAEVIEYKVVIGSREITGARRNKEPWYRHLMGRGFNFLVQNLAVPGIMDTQCGFKLFSADTAEKLFNSLYVYGKAQARQDAFTGAFDVELLYLAKKYQIKVKEIPVVWHHHETDRVNPIKDSVRMLNDIVKVRVADFQGRYSAT